MAGARRGLRVLDVAVLAVCLVCALGGAVVTMARGDAVAARRRVEAFVAEQDAIERRAVRPRIDVPEGAEAPAEECFAAHEWQEGVRRLFAAARDVLAVRRDYAWLHFVVVMLTDERLRAMPDAVLADLDARLVDLDARLPFPIDARYVLGNSARAVLDGRGDWEPKDRLRAWHTGGDCDAAELVELDAMLAHLDVLQPAATAWPSRVQQWREFDRRLTDDCFRPRRSELSWLMDLEERALRTRARLRLLRLALAFHRGLPLPTLVDPLGDGPLRATIAGDRADFSSADEYVVRTAVRVR